MIDATANDWGKFGFPEDENPIIVDE